MTEDELRVVLICASLILTPPNPYTRADHARVQKLEALAQKLAALPDVHVDVAALLPKVPAVCAAIQAKDPNAVEIALAGMVSVLAPLFQALADQVDAGGDR